MQDTLARATHSAKRDDRVFCIQVELANLKFEGLSSVDINFLDFDSIIFLGVRID